jgi:hypothetical protein
MKYYRDWWIATSLWWGFLALIVVVYIESDWTMSASGSAFFSQIVALFGSVGLAFSGIYLINFRLEKPLKSAPSQEERNILRRHKDLEHKERVLEQEEELMRRQDKYDKRREELLRAMETRAGVR